MYVALLVLNVVLFVLLVAACARSRAFSVFHPLALYLAFHGVVFVLRPILSWYYGYSMIYKLYQFSPDDYAKDMTLVAANVGLFAFAAASLRWGNAPLRNRFDRFAAMELQAMARPLWIVSLVLAPAIAWSLYEAWLLRASDLASLVLDPATGTTVNTVGNGYSQTLYYFGVILTPLLAWAGRFRWWALIPAAAFAFFQAGSGLRGPLISQLVCLAFLYLYTQRRAWPEWRTVALVLAAAVVFNGLGADRGQQIRSLVSNDGATVTQQDDHMAPLEGMDLGNLEYLEFLVDKVPRATGTYEYFVDNLQLFTEPVPRVLWKGKPIGQPIRFFYLFDYGYPIGMTRSLPGEGWTQLGLIGVAIWCGLWGGILGRIYTAFARSRQSVLQVAAYVSFLGTLIVFYRDGMLLTILRQGVFFLAPLALWALVARMLGTVSAQDLRRLVARRLARQQRRAEKDAAASASASEPASGSPSPEGPAAAPLLPRSLRHQRRTLAAPRS